MARFDLYENAVPDGPTDELIFWDASDGRVKNVTRAQLETIFSVVGHTHTPAETATTPKTDATLDHQVTLYDPALGGPSNPDAYGRFPLTEVLALDGGAVPPNTDPISVRLSSSPHRIAGLRDGDGNPIPNPFTVASIGGSGWRVLLPTSRPIIATRASDGTQVDTPRMVKPNVYVYPAQPPGTLPEGLLYELRVFGSVAVPSIATVQPNGQITVVFSEPVTGVTCAGDGTGTLEATDGVYFAPSISGSSTTWTLEPPVGGWTIGGTVTVTIKPTIASAADSSKLYDGLGYILAVDGTPPPHAPLFSLQPTLAAALYDGGTFNFSVYDSEGHNIDIEKWNGSAWVSVSTNVASGAQSAVLIAGLTAGTKTGLKFRVTDTGTANWVESTAIADFATAAPVLSSVTPGAGQNTITFADAAGDTADTFNIKWGTSSGSLTNTITGVTSPYVHSGLADGTTYYYQVVAIKGGLESLPSGEVSGKTATSILINFPQNLGTWTPVEASIKLASNTNTDENWLGQSFPMPAGCTRVDGVDVYVRSREGISTPAISADIGVHVYTDSASAPGTSLGSKAIPDFDSGEIYVEKSTASGSLATGLTPGSTYWIVFRGTAALGGANNVYYTFGRLAGGYASGIHKYKLATAAWTEVVGQDITMRIRVS